MDGTGLLTTGRPRLSGLERGLAWVLRTGLVAITRWLTGVRPVDAHALAQAGVAERPCVYFANHRSLADFIVLWTALPASERRRIRPVAAADHWGRTRWRRFLARDVFGAVLIGRAAREADSAAGPGGLAALDAMAAVLARGEALILFPEGTRNTGPAPLLPLRAGLASLARACPGVVLMPVWLEGTRRALPKGAWWPVPALCRVTLGEALEAGPRDTVAEVLAQATAALLALRPDARPQLTLVSRPVPAQEEVRAA